MAQYDAIFSDEKCFKISLANPHYLPYAMWQYCSCCVCRSVSACGGWPFYTNRERERGCGHSSLKLSSSLRLWCHIQWNCCARRHNCPQAFILGSWPLKPRQCSARIGCASSYCAPSLRQSRGWEECLISSDNIPCSQWEFDNNFYFIMLFQNWNHEMEWAGAPLKFKCLTFRSDIKTFNSRVKGQLNLISL